MTLRLRLWGSIVALAISAILGTGVSGCGTVAGAGQDGAGNTRAWLQY